MPHSHYQPHLPDEDLSFDDAHCIITVLYKKRGTAGLYDPDDEAPAGHMVMVVESVDDSQATLRAFDYISINDSRIAKTVHRHYLELQSALEKFFTDHKIDRDEELFALMPHILFGDMQEFVTKLRKYRDDANANDISNILQFAQQCFVKNSFSLKVTVKETWGIRGVVRSSLSIITNDESHKIFPYEYELWDGDQLRCWKVPKGEVDALLRSIDNDQAHPEKYVLAGKHNTFFGGRGINCVDWVLNKLRLVPSCLALAKSASDSLGDGITAAFSRPGVIAKFLGATGSQSQKGSQSQTDDNDFDSF